LQTKFINYGLDLLEVPREHNYVATNKEGFIYSFLWCPVWSAFSPTGWAQGGKHKLLKYAPRRSAFDWKQSLCNISDFKEAAKIAR